ncbi:Hypothetical protein SRAE_2000381700 [Strongyloides ratti]|uniref:Uncharacterized protein n=1 Tax=Strongyloides ratti TaxID=34506 RepID=A0A090LH97_STRRB|nr:Hypothetical protein SRAE_2000381700 [Strongyloides ratti]CEF69166.1 Hypothetical protein SRAE_2000381700 [Strongyloides ratti]
MSSIDTDLNLSDRNYNKDKKGRKSIFGEFIRPQTPVIVVEDFEGQLPHSSVYSSGKISELQSDITYNYGFGQTNPHFLKVPSKLSNRKNVSLYEFNDCIDTLRIIQKITF